jgi:hypothetical protein
MKPRLHHIERGMLPWWTHRLTECGRDPERYPTWTRDQAVAEYDRLGPQQFSLVVCITCRDTANRHPDWDHNPISCINRHTEWVDDEPQVAAELRAIAALIDAHRDEFDQAVADHLTPTSLADKRRQRRLASLPTVVPNQLR